MKYSKYLLFGFFLCFFLVLETFASTEEIYSLDDFTMSKTVLNGSKIKTGNHYPEGLTILYDDVTLSVEKNSSFILGNGADNLCYSISKVEENVITFSKGACKDVESPNPSNDYTIGYKGLYKWYKVKNVSVNTDGFLKENDDYVGENGSLKVDFEASKGELLFFQMKSFILENSMLEVFLDGESIPYSSDSIFYHNYYLRVKEDGDHSLVIHYTNLDDSYVLLKGFMLLKECGNENKLSTFGMENRDRLYYEVMDKDLVASGFVVYFNYETLDGDPFVGENPNTVDIIGIIIAIFAAVLISLGISIYKVHKTQKFKVHEEIE